MAWHFIGTIQSKKVRKVILPGVFDLIHSVDSPKLARLISKACAEAPVRGAGRGAEDPPASEHLWGGVQGIPVRHGGLAGGRRRGASRAARAPRAGVDDDGALRGRRASAQGLLCPPAHVQGRVAQQLQCRGGHLPGPCRSQAGGGGGVGGGVGRDDRGSGAGYPRNSAPPAHRALDGNDQRLQDCDRGGGHHGEDWDGDLWGEGIPRVNGWSPS
mmetsp:Transcript_36919/g.116115  ORF Transcript_36919/g.116115 Transcript_36919/m.116115 type:complete len:215 (-) Transcript_36919:18-662(-)